MATRETDDEKALSLAAFTRMREEVQARRASLELRYPLPDPESWLAHANELAPNAVYALAGTLSSHPMNLQCSGLVLLASPTAGLVWTVRRGAIILFPERPDPDIAWSVTDGLLDEKHTRALWKACASADKRGLTNVPQTIYDGTPVSLVLRGPAGDKHATCNIAVSGNHPTLQLARCFSRAMPDDRR